MNKDRLLQKVRGVQQYLAIAAELMILAAFAMAGMDASLGGIMASIPWLKWLWAATLALGLDTAFVISWVRCRQIGWNWHQLWAVPLALGLSFIVFQPTAVQMLQQSLDITFTQALTNLGIDMNVLVYARAGVAVALGAILALTNVEGKLATGQSATRRVAIFDKLLNKVAPLVEQSAPPVPLEQKAEQSIEQSTEQIEHETDKHEAVKQSAPAQLRAVPDARERVRIALLSNPGVSDRELARLANLGSGNTAKRHREAIEQEQAS